MNFLIVFLTGVLGICLVGAKGFELVVVHGGGGGGLEGLVIV